MARDTQASGIRTPIAPETLQQLSLQLGGTAEPIRGGNEAFMPPGEPIAPVADSPQDQTVGRIFDYAVGINLRQRPRSDEQVSYAQMRALADGYDLLRLVIETRKDQMARMRWTFKPIDPKAKPDARCEQLIADFRMPDREHTWDEWMRMVVEEMLVTDAATIYPRMTFGGKPAGFDVMDGTMIKRVIDGTGRTPAPPQPAYQQIVKGLPVVDYTADELVFRPRNKRVHKLYGFSPVEQIIITINIALRRQLNQLSYYAEGNVPNLIFGVPKEWNPDQIKTFQVWWDSLLEGQSKHKGFFVPEGVQPYDTKQGSLKDEYDEWLARIVCFAFSIAPTPFIKQMNRATADNAKEQAAQEGLEPLMLWLKNLIDLLVVKYYGYTDIEFDWTQEEALDPQLQAEIDDLSLKNGSKTLDEVRQARGDDPYPDGLGAKPLIYTPQGAQLLVDVIDPPEPAPAPPALAGNDPAAAKPDEEKPAEDKAAPAGAKEALAKIKKVIRPIDRDRKAVTRAADKMQAMLAAFLKQQAPKIAEQLGAMLDLTSKADEPSEDMDRVNHAVDMLDFTDWTDTGDGSLVDNLKTMLVGTAVDGGNEALDQLGLFDNDVQKLMSERAAIWAQDRAAEMVGMKWVGDELVPNPDAKWQITEGTRELVRSLTTQAVDDGWSTDQLASALSDSYAFGDDRASVIARTETARADVSGSVEGWRASGVVSKKQWLAAPDCCDLCQDYDGDTVGLDESFQDGADVPLHPQCRCTVVPVLDDSADQ